jgi:NADH dehydrogenase (ubiquinone) Fe-S protein 4
MSLFRIGGATGLRATRLAAPVNVRFVSSVTKDVKTSPADAPSTPNKDSSLINKQSPSEAMTRHQPDYEATIDQATSYDTSHCSPGRIPLANMVFHCLAANSPQFPSA